MYVNISLLQIHVYVKISLSSMHENRFIRIFMKQVYQNIYETGLPKYT